MGRDILLKSVKLPNGETLAYREAGEGDRDVLLIHGNMSSSLSWDVFMESLPDGFRSIAVDLRGFGESTYKKPISAIKDIADDLKLFIEELDMENLIVAGWSAGGAVALQLAADYPVHIEKLILIESTSIKGFPVVKRDASGKAVAGQYVKTKKEMEKLLAGFKSTLEKKDVAALKKMCDTTLYLFNKPEEERYSNYIKEMAKQRNIEDFNYALSVFNISHDNNGLTDGTGEVDRISMPTLVIHGTKDYLVTKTMAEEIKNGIGDNASLVELSKSGHVPFVDNLAGLMDLVMNFINA